MAATGRGQDPALKAALARAPFGFDFFQAVRVLEWTARHDRAALSDDHGGNGKAEAPTVGALSLASEPVRFSGTVDTTFPASAIAGFDQVPVGATGERRTVLTTAFLGLTGPAGVLPHHYSDQVLRQWRARNRALRAFFDMFNHRLTALFYRSWAKHRLPVQFEQSFPGTPDAVTAIFAAVAGLGTKGVERRLEVPDLSIYYYAGQYGRTPPSAAGLEAVLTDYFGLSVRVEQFRPRWIDLAKTAQSRMPAGPGEPGTYMSLGVDAVAGEKVYDVTGGIRVRLGPMGEAAFRSFQPGGRGLSEAVDLIRLYVGPEFDFDVQCVIFRTDVPSCRVGDHAFTPRLGWNTWLASDDRPHDAEDAVFRPEDA